MLDQLHHDVMAWAHPHEHDLSKRSHGRPLGARAIALSRPNHVVAGRASLRSRRILDAIFDVLRTGYQWRYLPTNFPPWQTVCYHLRRFRINNSVHGRDTALHRTEREHVRRAPNPSVAIMESPRMKMVEESRTLRSYGGYAGGQLVKGRKRHLLVVDTVGLPIA